MSVVSIVSVYRERPIQRTRSVSHHAILCSFVGPTGALERAYSASITSVANSVQHVMGPVSTLFLSQDLQSSGVRYCLICFAQPVHDMDQFARQWQFTEEYSFQTPWCMENNHTCLWTSPQKVVDLAGVRSVLPTATMHQGLVCVSAAEERKWVDSHLHFERRIGANENLGLPPWGLQAISAAS